MIKNNFLLIVAVIMVIASGCKTAKKAQSQAPVVQKDTASMVLVNDNKADSIRTVQEALKKYRANRIDFQTFSGKIKVDYTDKKGKGPDLTVFVRMQKDSVIWLSVNATVFSYEAFRVMITPDSIVLLNKKEKEVQYKSLGFLQELTQLPLDFTTFQDLLIGNAIFLDSNIVSFKKYENSLLIRSTGKFFNHLMTLASNDFSLQHSTLTDVNTARSRNCDLHYSDYENKNGMLFPVTRKITVTDTSRLEIDMSFKQYSFNEILSYPFSIPKNYKRN